jgi:hypothetical protein
VDAVRWYANGDHPDDGPRSQEGQVVRYFRDPYRSGLMPCWDCGTTFHLHGWMDLPGNGRVVCPGDWIVTEAQDRRYPVKDSIFQRTFEPLEAS